ncbi:(Fe-S)-binding protein [Streptomyces sp. SCL15-6]|uniref:(Fe-S)-binding protein n=1 Tax=Streptomyces sp. SCL15-6 TaxID=2967222 RepID=UPI0029663784|nr:(Fe-S)-binding protein [Streptomyces sp. SCL15-6]
MPEGLGDLCCGIPWQSKGYTAGHRTMAARTLEALWQAADRAGCPWSATPPRAPTAWSNSPTPWGEPDRARFASLRFVDSVVFIAEHLLPAPTPRRLGSLALHPTCSTVHLGIDDALRIVAAAVGDEVTAPDSWGCCAFAGDRGLLHPEITAAATAAQAAEITERTYDAYASCNRTCETGMTRATGRPYRHLLELLDEATA